MPLSAPRSISPSKVTSFTDCPLAFRFSVLERRPEPPSAAAVKGTLVHRTLEGLFWSHPPGARTPEAARHEFDLAWAALGDDPEWAALGLSPEEETAFRADAETLTTNYFAIEDPNTVNPVGVELGLEADLGDVRLRGIIDRLDLTESGDLVVIDYKTGRAPSERYERAKMSGVHIYALLCEVVLGRPPVEVRLLHLREPISIVAVPTEQTLRGQRRRTEAVWDAIERACDKEDFRPRPGPLCRFCNFQALCPANGGTLPDVAVAS
ncbi:MAG TPA: PD-(D/E)XK nuclease family protein [Acidimicrobiales bacterium]|nr:PD-(D/E)XK nuclease family protein [Acidimicrobiales bacterium]